MFEKKLRNLTVAKSLEKKPPFDENFWGRYVDSLSKNVKEQYGDPLQPNPKKYHSKSFAVTKLQKYFEHLKLPRPSANEAITALKSPFTQGDLVKAFHFIRFFQLSSEGLFLTNENRDKLGHAINYVGAENWGNVMCYLDALFFSMFANLESFEPILFISNKHPNHLVYQLAALLRLYVNLIRSGNLITTDITIRLCEILEQLGFEEAMSRRQQDSAALFEFLTEILAMPLLTFKIDIKHGGKFSKEDDQKYSKERILFVSIPDDEANHDDNILLEECLEHYFNNSISVKRELERRATLESLRKEDSQNPLLGTVEVRVSNGDQTVESDVRGSEKLKRSDSKNQVKVTSRARSSTLSLWSLNDADVTPSNPREVNLPAWMFLRLLPFYTDDNASSGTNSSSAVRNSKEFVNRRPVLPICLKRYSFDSSNSLATRSSKRIIIPPIINLPQFVADDDNDETSGDYKLILESAVCHRGTSISSGHYISVVRKDTNNVNESEEEATNAIWYLYDDVNKKSRITEKSFKQIFQTEWPYMLFYRLISNEESNSSSNTSANVSANSSIRRGVTVQKSVLPPQGSKVHYWSETEPLTPIISSTNSPSLRSVEGITESINSSTSSILSLDISPNDSKFIDIRDKYFWYLTDDDMNYYKELPTNSTFIGREPSISISQKLRRNSQWSAATNHSKHHLQPNESRTSLSGDELYALGDKVTVLDLDKLSKSASNKSKVPEQIEDVAVGKIPSTSPKPSDKHSDPIINHISTEDSKTVKSKRHKRFHKRREEYKNEKCIIA
ncbi:uncharacterized protein PRCAT00000876001 [Priceomyces carsonii]|uniref:uncharacterized protein n=1 Tax=Priceomyces carsonii TaxID=28549 RepID=UPI002EDAC99D|nr:unnamed protein product [Priceomyces carsonii]